MRLGTDGRITDYALVTTAPAALPYSSGGDTVDFLITPGGIPFALGDTFVAEIEAAASKRRRDGGAWSSAIDIATTALADGLSVQFSGGVAPSWAAGDRWSYRAEGQPMAQCRCARRLMASSVDRFNRDRDCRRRDQWRRHLRAPHCRGRDHHADRQR